MCVGGGYKLALAHIIVGVVVAVVAGVEKRGQVAVYNGPVATFATTTDTWLLLLYILACKRGKIVTHTHTDDESGLWTGKKGEPTTQIYFLRLSHVVVVVPHVLLPVLLAHLSSQEVTSCDWTASGWPVIDAAN